MNFAEINRPETIKNAKAALEQYATLHTIEVAKFPSLKSPSLSGLPSGKNPPNVAEQQNVDYLDKYGWMGDYCSRCRNAVDELPQLYCDLLTNEYLSNQQSQKVEVLADRIGLSRATYFRKKQAALVAFALECQYLPDKQGSWKRLVVW